MIQRKEFVKKVSSPYLHCFYLAVFLLTAHNCSHRQMPLPEYDKFVAARQPAVNSIPVAEFYGRYSASAGAGKASSHFNLLIDPGKRAYLEIVDGAERLLYSLSIDQEQISLFWAQQGKYIQEKASPETLKAIAGFPLPPDDVLMLIAGQGLNFPEWQLIEKRKNGWKLGRSNYTAELTMKGELSKIQLVSSSSGQVVVQYDQYQNMNEKFVPTRIRLEAPADRMKIELRVEKSLPRDEAPKPEMFALQIPTTAQRVTLKELYHGKPLLLEK